MSSSDAMFEASSVYFQYVNERAAHLKIDPVSVDVDLGLSISLISLVSDSFRLLGGFMNENQKALGV